MVTIPPSGFSCFFFGGRGKKRTSDSGRAERKTVLLFSCKGVVATVMEESERSLPRLLEEEEKEGSNSSRTGPSPFFSTFFFWSLDFLFKEALLEERRFSFVGGGGESPIEAREDIEERLEEEGSEIIIQGGEMGGVRCSSSCS